MRKRLIYVGVGGFVVLLIGFALTYSHFFGPVDRYATQTEFIVTEGQTTDQINNNLKREGFIRSRLAFQIAIGGALIGRQIRPGGYEISASMDIWTIASLLTKPPYLVFFKFPPGWRKEQIAEKLASTFAWTAAQKTEWINIDTAPSPSFVEGVYYPDTYLIPSDQSPALVAQRFRDRFQQVFAPFAIQAEQQNIPWTMVVNLASLIEREAAGPKDMPIIAGILWNRLDHHMALQLDDTLQYVKGDESNWWPVPTSADKFIESPFNTYRHVGLPPHPIDEPSLTAINAVLNPQKTDCIFYLHDTNGQIHCSVTYKGQVANVNKYLK
ncbi:endolytic transglycosylase MltG [Patescibacteria group bacterium]|nr:endolytic transglycosylase MltG [Patescibacteria group bacterium]